MIWAGSTCGCARFSTGRRGVGPNPTPPSRQLLPKCLSPNNQSLTAGKDRQYGASGSVGLLSIFFFAFGRAVQIRPAPPFSGGVIMPGIERRSKSSPCRYCQDRYPACSDHCKKPEFLAWKAEQETIRENRRKYYSPIWKHDEPLKGPKR